ncbi:MAG: metallopeptidase family protein [candidate division NC10 bacterium]|nr:metallopeptidase family protein [candidate division NC10 bacterium]
MARLRRVPRGGGPTDTPLRRRLEEIRRGRSEFEGLVADAVKSLPPQFRKRLENVEVMIEDLPTVEELKSVGIEPGGALLGLYRGIPQNELSVWTNRLTPDQIVIFRRPLEAMTRDRRELIRQIRITIMHEVGHFFGLDEDDLQEYGYG